MKAAPSRVVLAELRRLEREKPPGMHSREAWLYELWHRKRVAEGHPPDALQNRSPVESERFWAQTAQGPDGHLYWLGNKKFKLNDGREWRPARWVWTQGNGAISPYTDVWNDCGEEHCVALAHLQVGRVQRHHRFRYSDEQMIGAIQTLALRLGHTPTRSDYEKSGMQPVYSTICFRFGSWQRALAGAGMHSVRVRTDEDIIEAIRALAREIGRVPREKDWREHGRWLKEQGLVSGLHTPGLRFGSFAKAVERSFNERTLPGQRLVA